MLPKNRRIDREDFEKIMSSGKRYNSDSFILYLTPINKNKPHLPSRFSFSASKKISKLAVERNKLRRRGYSIVEKNIKKLKPGFFGFFSYKKGFQKDFKLLEKEVLGLLYSSGMII